MNACVLCLFRNFGTNHRFGKHGGGQSPCGHRRCSSRLSRMDALPYSIVWLVWKPNAKDERRYRSTQEGSTDNVRREVFVVHHSACCYKTGQEHWRITHQGYQPVESLLVPFLDTATVIAGAAAFAVEAAQPKGSFEVHAQEHHSAKTPGGMVRRKTHPGVVCVAVADGTLHGGIRLVVVGLTYVHKYGTKIPDLDIKCRMEANKKTNEPPM